MKQNLKSGNLSLLGASVRLLFVFLIQAECLCWTMLHFDYWNVWKASAPMLQKILDDGLGYRLMQYWQYRVQVLVLLITTHGLRYNNLWLAPSLSQERLYT